MINLPSDPSERAVLQIDTELAEPGLQLFSTYDAPNEETGHVVIPGSLQTPDYAAWATKQFGLPPERAALAVAARLKRLDLVLQQPEAKAEFFIHPWLTENEFANSAGVLVPGLRRMVDVASQHPKADRLTIRVVPENADEDIWIRRLQGFILINNGSGKVILTGDGAERALQDSYEHRQAPIWRARLGELALSHDESLDFLRSEADRLESR